MFIVSTPNKNTYSATGRNPFHVREFYLHDLSVLLQSFFQKVNMFGVYSSAKLENLGNKVEKTEALIDNLYLRPFVGLIPIKIKKVLSAHLFRIHNNAFSVSRINSEECLDFLAVCVK